MPTTSEKSTPRRAGAILLPPAPPLGLPDLLLVLAMIAMLLYASWFRSQNRIFWGDEIMGWLVLRQDTWAHLLRLWYAGIDSSGIFFYVFARPWLRLFGPTELALHLFSAMGMALGFALTWVCARRFYRVQVVAAVAPAVFLVNRTALWQLANGRTYGVLMTAVALTCCALVRTSPEQEHANDRWSVALTAVASMLLVGSHILGVLYWSVFFAGLLGRDAWFRIFRPRLYLAALAGLSVLVVSWKNIAATAALGKPVFWTFRPHLRQLPNGFDDFSSKTGMAIMLAALVFVLLLVVQRAKGNRESLLVPRRATLYFILAAFALMALGIFAVSRVSTPIFVDRYMLPIMIGDMLLLCELASRIVVMLRLSTHVQSTCMALALAAVALMYRADLSFEYYYPQRDYTVSLLQRIPTDEPAVLIAQGTFVEMVFYHNADRRFETPIDWNVQLDPDFGPGGASGTHELENWKAVGFYSSQIKPTAEILAGKQRFSVIADFEHTLWMRRYLLANPAYRVTELPRYAGFRIWQVDKK